MRATPKKELMNDIDTLNTELKSSGKELLAGLKNEMKYLLKKSEDPEFDASKNKMDMIGIITENLQKLRDKLSKDPSEEKQQEVQKINKVLAEYKQLDQLTTNTFMTYKKASETFDAVKNSVKNQTALGNPLVAALKNPRRLSLIITTAQQISEQKTRTSQQFREAAPEVTRTLATHAEEMRTLSANISNRRKEESAALATELAQLETERAEKASQGKATVVELTIAPKIAALKEEQQAIQMFTAPPPAEPRASISAGVDQKSQAAPAPNKFAKFASQKPLAGIDKANNAAPIPLAAAIVEKAAKLDNTAAVVAEPPKMKAK